MHLNHSLIEQCIKKAGQIKLDPEKLKAKIPEDDRSRTHVHKTLI
jgi:hypothetical protein